MPTHVNTPLLGSTDVPAPQGNPTTLTILKLTDGENGTGNAPVARSITSGMVDGASARHNRNATNLDLLARFGAGGYAVIVGLDFTVPGSGLVLTVKLGQAYISGLVELAANATITLPNSTAHVYIWLRQNATLTYTTTTTAPSGVPAVYIGTVATSGGNIGTADYSGVVFFQGSLLFRQTSDKGKPIDNPGSGTSVFTQTLTGLFLWDGAVHRCIQGKNDQPLTKSVAGGVDVTLADADLDYDFYVFTGAITANINVIFPLGSYMFRRIWNNTTGAHTLTVKGATGTGVAVTQGKLVDLWTDGTNWKTGSSEVTP